MHKIITLVGAALAAPLTATLVMPLTAHAATPQGKTGLLVAAGHATPDARVRLYAWPPVADRLLPGQRVPRTLLATTTADAAGTYVLRASPVALSAAALPSGLVNLEADSGSASWFFVWRTSHAAGQTLTAASRAAPATVNLRGRPDHCGGWVFRRQLKASWAIVGQSYVLRTATDVLQSFTYSAGQSSSLGVGISATGKYGSFHAHGTVSRSANFGEDFPAYSRGNEWYRTKFRVAKYRMTCGNLLQGITHSYLVRSDGYAGGATVMHPRTAPHAPNRYCQPQVRGSRAHTYSESAVEWSAGFTMMPVGFDASTQTGYDHSAELTFTFHRRRYICGTNAQPAEAHQLVAKRKV